MFINQLYAFVSNLIHKNTPQSAADSNSGVEADYHLSMIIFCLLIIFQVLIHQSRTPLWHISITFKMIIPQKIKPYDYDLRSIFLMIILARWALWVVRQYVTVTVAVNLILAVFSLKGIFFRLGSKRWCDCVSAKVQHTLVSLWLLPAVFHSPP